MLCAALPYRQPEKLTDHNATLALLLAMSAVFIAASALGALALNSSSQDSATLLRLLDNLRFFIAIPLISSLLLCSSFKLFFTRAGWGRWVLALCALFELTRRMEVGGHYAAVLTYLCTISLFIAFIKLPLPWVKKAGTVATIFYGLSLCILGDASLLPLYQNIPASNITLAMALVLTGVAGGKLISHQQKVA